MPAWIFDCGHRARSVTCDPMPGERPLAALERGLAPLPVGGPVGARGPDFCFLLPQPGGPGFEPMSAWSRDEGAWRLYVEVLLGGWEPPTRSLDVFFFGDGPELAAKLGHMVLKGVKRGTAGWIAAAEREGATIPHAGLVSIVTDGFGYPQCAIRSERVTRQRFADISEAQAFTEGEGDRSLADWRAGHRAYFEREATRLGLIFDDDSEIVFEEFRVLAILGRAD
jgi:uncharacterized protein YhfF